MPTASRYSCSKRAASALPRFHSGERVERLVELGVAPVLARVCARRWSARRVAEVRGPVPGRAKAVISSLRARARATRRDRRRARRRGPPSPTRRRLRAGRRRRHELAHQAEHGPDLALGRPAVKPIGAARPADAHQLVGDGLVVGREHRADRRHHHVEATRRRTAGARRPPRPTRARGPRPPRARWPGLEQFGRQVAGGHAAPALGGGDRGVAGAGRDVEDAHARRRCRRPRRVAARAAAGTSRPSTSSRPRPTSRGAAP